MCFRKRKTGRRGHVSMQPSGTTSSTLDSNPLAESSRGSFINGMLASDGPTLFTLHQLSQATDRFSRSKCISESVWHGSLRNRGLVAIVRKQGSSSLAPSDFEQTLRAFNSLNHFNLAKLYGVCQERGRLYLVYELVEGASLRDCLRRSQKSPYYSALGTWTVRMQIAIDIAKGIEYLHHHATSGKAIVHKHIKSSNILVTGEHRAKIAYCGLAELTGELEQDLRQMEYPDFDDAFPSSPEEGVGHGGGKPKQSNKIQMVASQGYTPPEYSLGGIVTAKYDVYAFGIILLELLSGKEAFYLRAQPSKKAPKMTTLAEEIRSLLEQPEASSALRLWMDPTLKDSFPMEDAQKVAVIARTCIDYHHPSRPEMGYVARKLSKLLVSAQEWEESRSTSSTTVMPR